MPARTKPIRAPTDAAGEAALLRRASAGDREAFAALVRRHAGALLRFATTLTREPSRAEELVQETWLAALESLERFEGRSTLRTWLFGVLAHRARSLARLEGRTVLLAAATDGADADVLPDLFDLRGAWKDPPEAWAEKSPERLIDQRETRAALEQAIAALPDAQRAVITLRDLEGLETEEICNLLGLTVTNQRVLLHRARTRVREALERYQSGADGC